MSEMKITIFAPQLLTMYKTFIRPLLFLFSPEKAHAISMGVLRSILWIPGCYAFLKRLFKTPVDSKQVAGLAFPNSVGLAAGFDKDGRYIRPMSLLGFGHIEVGTVTPLPQPGNPRPRLFRLPVDHAIINRMGFNNQGVDALVNRLAKMQRDQLIIGGNIGKNKWTPNEKAVEDYVICFRKLHAFVDYFVVNVSSPNTPNLRLLQEADALNEILQTLQSINAEQTIQRPIFLKIAPDLSFPQLDEIIEVVIKNKIAGVIATNTTIARKDLRTSDARLEQIGNGGLSGAPLQARSLEVVRYLRKGLPVDFAIIGVGGINGPESAINMLDAGADLIQIFSGMIYEGPALAKKILKVLPHSTI